MADQVKLVGVERHAYEARLRTAIGAVRGNRTQHLRAVARRNNGVLPLGHTCSTCDRLNDAGVRMLKELSEIYVYDNADSFTEPTNITLKCYTSSMVFVIRTRGTF